MNIEDIFNESVHKPEDLSYADRVVQKIENDFEGNVTIDYIKARNDEKAEIVEKIAKLRRRLRKVKNVTRNPKIVKINADKRKKIRDDIRRLRMRMDEIQTEENAE